MAPQPSIEALAFDLDGTITRPVLDFDAIRAEIGIPAGLPILEYLETAAPAVQALGAAVLERHEQAAALASELNDGADALFAYLDRRRLPLGLVTRNTVENARAVLDRHGLRFASIVGRACARPKPHPDALLRVARELGVPPQRMAMVGDFRYDLEAGRAASMTTVLVTNGEPKPYASEADWVVDRLDALIDWLEGGAGAP